MPILRLKSWTPAMAFVLLLTGCGSMDRMLGGRDEPAPREPAASTPASEVRGYVQGVDPGTRTLRVGQRAPGQLGLRESASWVLTWDHNTLVEYKGQKSYNPQDLEVGDQIQARVDAGGGRSLARHIVVLTSVSDSGAVPAPNAQLRGTVRNVDQARRTIELDGATWARRFDERATPGTRVEFDANTIVEYRGQRYGVSNLEPGDVIDVEVGSIPTGLLAKRIVVAQAR